MLYADGFVCAIDRANRFFTSATGFSGYFLRYGASRFVCTIDRICKEKCRQPLAVICDMEQRDLFAP